MTNGIFISFEGGEGAGKSTQIKILADDLKSKGYAVTLTREPGGSPLAEAIRTLLLTDQAASDDAMTQGLLLAAARRDHILRTITPALEKGAVVLCDRFADSTRAYQGGRLKAEEVDTLIALATHGLSPHLTILLDISPDLGLMRAKSRAGHGDPFEREDIAFHEGVRSHFLAQAKAEPDRFLILDATKPPLELADMIRAEVQARFGALRK